MTAYAIAHIGPGELHEEVFTYMDRIQSTFAPFGGHFLVHATPHEVLEGEWRGGPVLVSFPDLEAGRAWYRSAAYQEILPLRTRHLAGDIILVDGVPEGYDAGATADRLRAAQ
ncbi:DUF1330 domain-containing protein [Streptomyces sp. NPDC048442]|uniref:DUF1330 domain-containing protein n=1 Tax=Streptomyces sp. NPDC048442 TaxID=3154823 RepID=UPI003446EE0B